MRELGIDIETYSSEDLARTGVYRYAEAEDFRVLLFGYSVDGGKAVCVDLEQGEELPAEIREALTDASVVKTAYNANFERVCLSRYLFGDTGEMLDPAQWQCTKVQAARAGFPLSLEDVANVLRLDEGKMKEGRALIRYFSRPAKNGRHLPADDMERWQMFKAYNIRDVEVEQAVLRKVRRVPVPEFEHRLYIADQRILDRGVLIDRLLVENAARMDEEMKGRLLDEARELTGLENPNSAVQLKDWLHRLTGTPVESLAKTELDALESRLEYFPKAQRVLQLRREAGKTSNKKYSAMLECVCKDGRIRGMLQYYGTRTGRWAGRLVQVQNLPQNHLPTLELDSAREVVRMGDTDELSLLYEKPTETLSELIRTAFVAPAGKKFHVCDFSAIEARVIAWLAGEEWVLDVFRRKQDIYCKTASRMFGVPVEKHGANAHLRAKGKIATLALGYGGGVSALEAMGGARLGLTEQEETDIVRLWRDSNPRIVRLWAIVEKAAIAAIQTGKEIKINRDITFGFLLGMLTIKLPSERLICYPRAEVETETTKWGKTKQTIRYEGVNQTTRKWETQRTYGGKLTENIVQAIARDILGEVLLRQERADGFDVVFHVHDEIICEVDPETPTTQVENHFSLPPAWAYGLPLSGEAFANTYYKK